MCSVVGRYVLLTGPAVVTVGRPGRDEAVVLRVGAEREDELVPPLAGESSDVTLWGCAEDTDDAPDEIPAPLLLPVGAS